MTDLDDRVHAGLERLVSRAPLPLSVEAIMGGRTTPKRQGRPVLIGLAAAAVLIVLIAGGVILRQQEGGGDDSNAVTADGGDPTGIPSSEPDAIVYMSADATEEELDAMASLLDDPRVDEVTYVDQEAALEEFRQLYADDPALLENVTAEILPSSFRVVLVDDDPASVAELLDAVRSSAGVQQVDLDPSRPLPQSPPSTTVVVGDDQIVSAVSPALIDVEESIATVEGCFASIGVECTESAQRRSIQSLETASRALLDAVESMLRPSSPNYPGSPPSGEMEEILGSTAVAAANLEVAAHVFNDADCVGTTDQCQRLSRDVDSFVSQLEIELEAWRPYR